MVEFKCFGTVLKRCKLQGVLGLVVGSPSQLEIRNTRALEILRGMMKQSENKDLFTFMRIEWEFLKARERYLKTGKLKKPLIRRALYIAESECKNNEDFIKFINLRTQAYISYASVKTDRDLIKEMNSIVNCVSIKSVRNILLTHTEPTAEYTHVFQGIPLIFHEETLKNEFISKNYKNVIRKLRSKTDFDSLIILAVSKVEEFKKGLHSLEERNDKISKKTLPRYMSQWNQIYTQAVDLFAANYLDEEYLHTVNQEISYIPQDSSLLFHPVSYDVASLYINMPQEEPIATAGISGMLSRMSLFRRK
ncbi:hypothetical protein NEAUS04_0966 [Nematocida ausubeli]|uniref:Uncharacterized protein n=1 Tax=Nematocida ausubeli (strain ATCC PRA-371 / ERTm2) TaxID=1913371 RepID=A0A086J5H2_NEMA1|nr:uncharacterized protein NESG_00468 [Nematocida ausubeli]KAI5162238.1 hypothetical protein NEAUS04_0966 [Nematocida ausubeli]KFG27390.1 hypothetical protein NESG_00468 [Nematocida ausubeli]